MSTFIITTLNGVSYAFILFLLAAGFSLTFGVMGVLNLAHGALFVLGAYFGLAIISQLDQFWLGVVVAAAGTGLVGLGIYYFFLRHLYGKVPEQAVLTIGLGYAIANIVLWVWGPFAKMGLTPETFTGVVRVGDLAFPIYRLVIFGIGLAVLVFLWWMQDKTRVGAIIRAGMDNKEMTRSLGINYGLVSTLVFLFGAALAGFAGISARRSSAPSRPWVTRCSCSRSWSSWSAAPATSRAPCSARSSSGCSTPSERPTCRRWRSSRRT